MQHANCCGELASAHKLAASHSAMSAKFASSIHEAAFNANVEDVRRLLKEGASVEPGEDKASVALHHRPSVALPTVNHRCRALSHTADLRAGRAIAAHSGGTQQVR